MSSLLNFIRSFIENHPDFVVLVVLLVAFAVFIVRDNFYLKKEVTNHLPTQIKEVKGRIDRLEDKVGDGFKEIKKEVNRLEYKMDKIFISFS